MISTLSIIIPAYNEQRTIHLILDNVRNVTLQGGMKKEIIIVNDGSTDDSAGAVRSYVAAKPDVPIRFS